jgi:hypothetical protein
MDATRTFRAMKNEILTRWRRWAAALADGDSPPPALEVLEAGAVLGVREPMAALEADAAAIQTHRQLQATADRTAAAVADRLAADGGPAGVRERLAAARAEVRRLTKLSGLDPRSLAAARARTQADAIAAGHPRAFPATPSAKRKGAARGH